MKKYDIIVAGGGFAGTAAAIAAARRGASVLIVEKSNCLGGAAANSLVLPFMRFYTQKDGGQFDLTRGIFSEICSCLAELGALKGPTFGDEELKLVLNRMVVREGIDILFRVRMYEAVCENNNVRAIKAACIGGSMTFTADCFIDASGDAELAQLCGCPYHVGREIDGLCQPMTLCFRMGNVDVDKFNENKSRIQELYTKYRIEDKIKNPRENILTFRTITDSILHLNTTRVIKKSPVDPFDITAAEIEAREQVYEMFLFLRENAVGCENATLISTGMETGVRESRMIDGKYTLTKDDLLSFRKFSDSIAACNYDIDIHNPDGSGTSHYYFPDGEYYTIPYRCLLPQNADNLIVAGRCISSDHDAQASYRIMPTVCSLGEAAGAAAALAVKGDRNFQNVNIRTLQKSLTDNGAFIGEI